MYTIILYSSYYILQLLCFLLAYLLPLIDTPTDTMIVVCNLLRVMFVNKWQPNKHTERKLTTRDIVTNRWPCNLDSCTCNWIPVHICNYTFHSLVYLKMIRNFTTVIHDYCKTNRWFKLFLKFKSHFENYLCLTVWLWYFVTITYKRKGKWKGGKTHCFMINVMK